MIRIGFLDRTDPSWTAGASYSRSMVHALAGAIGDRGELCVVSGAQGALRDLPEGVRTIRAECDRLTPVIMRDLVKTEKIDVLLPVTEALLAQTECAMVGWIPDFQHLHLPQYFTAEQRTQRDRHFAYLIGNCDAMMFSSESVRADFRKFFPDFPGVSASVHFCSSLAWEKGIATGDPTTVLEKYQLPAGFVLVANQFWKHKNHLQVVQAVAHARKANPDVHVVMVGMLNDARDVSNPHLTKIIQKLTTERLFENISILGEVPFPDLVALLRTALAIIQPSEFEGWNTTIQDALAFGKPVACSDISAHREQVPDAFFFRLGDAGSLGGYLSGLDFSNHGWAGLAAEEASLEAERERGRSWASDFIDFCREVSATYRTVGRVRQAWVDPIDEIRANPLSYIDYLEQQVLRLSANEAASQAKLDGMQQRWDEAREKTAAERKKFQERLAAAQQDIETIRGKYSREIAKPLRARLVEEVRRRLKPGSNK